MVTDEQLEYFLGTWLKQKGTGSSALTRQPTRSAIISRIGT